MNKLDEIKKNLKEVNATNSVENIYLTKAEEDLIIKRQLGEITQKELIEKALELSRNERK